MTNSSEIGFGEMTVFSCDNEGLQERPSAPDVDFAALRGQLGTAASALELDAGQRILDPSQADAGIVLLEKGAVRCYVDDAEGRQRVVRMVYAPALIGVADTVLGRSPSYRAETVTSVTALRISAQVWRANFAELPRWQRIVLNSLAHEVAELSRTHEVSLRSAEARLADVLLDFAERFGQQSSGGLLLRHKLTQEYLANHIGAADRSVRRIMRRWRSSGWISISRGWLVLENVDALRRVFDN